MLQRVKTNIVIGSGDDRTIVAGIGQSDAPYLGHTNTVTLGSATQTIVMHLTAALDGT